MNNVKAKTRHPLLLVLKFFYYSLFIINYSLLYSLFIFHLLLKFNLEKHHLITTEKRCSPVTALFAN